VSEEEGGFDCLIVLSQNPIATCPESYQQHISEACRVDKRIEAINTDGGAHLVICGSWCPGGRLVLASTGRIDREYDDVRRVSEAATAAMDCALAAGAIRPLLITPGPGQGPFLRSREVRHTVDPNPKQ